MIKFDIKHRYTGEVKFTAEIDCGELELRSIKLGLAVKCGVENKADLMDANLMGANLRGANLEGVDLGGADLEGAYLKYANLRGADLMSANLTDADLTGADLRGAYLAGADLRGANLTDADLTGAYLRYVIGNMREVKSLRCDVYKIVYTHDCLIIGCERHLIQDWWKFDNKRILQMDGKDALEWWKKWKPILQGIIEVSPAIECGNKNTEKEHGK